MILHIVQSGDTIFSISNLYGVSVQRIINDNGLIGLPSLVVGQCLIILQPTVVHTVSAGDTLSSIAQLYDISIIKLLQNNPSLIFNTNILPNQQLAIEFDNQTNISLEIYGYLYPFIRRNLLPVQSIYSTSIAIFSYGFTLEGEVIQLDDYEIINTLNQTETIPILLLSSITNEGNFENEKTSVLFNDTNLQNILIDNLIVTMIEKGYNGIDLDFEYINPDDKEAYIGFVQNVTGKMNANGFSVNVDLAPKTSDTQAGLLYEGHDYARLGEAANTVLLMTYEWGYKFGPAMAVAPINKVRQVVEYALSNIPAEKIYLGIPNYGYDWILPYVRGESEARVIGNEEAIRIAQRYGVEIFYDETSQSPYFNYQDEQGRTHEVWFEDARSIREKFNLITEFNLRGGGYWNLMRSFSQNWAYVNSTYIIKK